MNKMKLEDRAAIIDKIHKLRMDAFDTRVEICKPIMPVVREKDRLMEQYFQAKRKMRDVSPIVKRSPAPSN